MTPPRQIFVALLVLGLGLVPAAPARAGVIGLFDRQIEISAQLESLLREGLAMLHRAVVVRSPGMMQVFPAPSADDLSGLVCNPAHTPVIHATLIGVNEFASMPNWRLKGGKRCSVDGQCPGKPRGLAEMPQDAFTAAKLYQGFLSQPVAGLVAQEPQYRTLRELGHFGGDVVFIADAGSIDARWARQIVASGPSRCLICV